MDRKEAARNGLLTVGKDIDLGDTQLWTRVNALDSPWVLDDLVTLVTEIGDRLDVVMVPKVEGPEDVHYVDRLLAQLEAQAYETEQKTALSAEAKAVLDSWVRYEGQVKVRQQQELAQSIIAKIEKELENPKTLDQILKQSVADVERECFICDYMYEETLTNFHRRHRFPEGLDTIT